MLPERLSTGRSSLHEGMERLADVAEMDVGHEGWRSAAQCACGWWGSTPACGFIDFERA